MYVLKFKTECPELMMEHFYDEVVTVRNGIALVNMEHNKNSLLGMNYDEIGTVDSEVDLPGLLQLLDKPALEVRKEVKTLDLDKVKFVPKPKEERKSMIEMVK